MQPSGAMNSKPRTLQNNLPLERKVEGCQRMVRTCVCSRLQPATSLDTPVSETLLQRLEDLQNHLSSRSLFHSSTSCSIATAPCVLPESLKNILLTFAMRFLQVAACHKIDKMTMQLEEFQWKTSRFYNHNFASRFLPLAQFQFLKPQTRQRNLSSLKDFPVLLGWEEMHGFFSQNLHKIGFRGRSGAGPLLLNTPDPKGRVWGAPRSDKHVHPCGTPA